MRFARSMLALAVLWLVAAAASAQAPGPVPAGPSQARTPPAYKYVWAAKPSPLTPWVAPNRPHWQLSEILAAHAGQKSWIQPLIRDNAYAADYIQMAPGEKTGTMMYAENDMFWIVQAGQMRVTIQGQEPFVASKGFVVWVPYRLPFSMETVGDTPVLRFQVTHAGATPLYAIDQPPPANGVKYVKVAYTGAPGTYPAGTKPYLDYQTEVIATGTPVRRFLPDGNLIRGAALPLPPDSDQGHFHTEHNEFWFILEGKMTYLIEGAPLFTAEQGDVAYAPAGHFHRITFAGDGMATRLSVAPQSPMADLDPDNPSRY